MYEIQYDLDPLPKDSSPKNRNSVIYSALCYSEAMWLLIWITNEGNTAERIMVWCKNVICLSQKNSCETTCLSFWPFIKKIHKNLTFHWIIRIKNGGNIIIKEFLIIIKEFIIKLLQFWPFLTKRYQMASSYFYSAFCQFWCLKSSFVFHWRRSSKQVGINTKVNKLWKVFLWTIPLEHLWSIHHEFELARQILQKSVMDCSMWTCATDSFKMKQ